METIRPLTDRPLLPTLLRLSWPIMVGQAMHLMYNLVDAFWVGRLGIEHLAAITVSFPVIFLAFSLGIGFSVSGVALVAQFTGAGRREEANRAAGQVILSVTAVAILFAVLSLIFGHQLLSLFGAGPKVLPLAWQYFRVLVFGVPLIFIFLVFSSVCEGVGDVITPMKLKVASVLLNIVLDPILIFGFWRVPAFGISGAAAATVIARGAVSIIGIYLLFSGKNTIHLRLRHLRPDWSMQRLILRIGIPMSIGSGAVALALACLTFIVATVADVEKVTLAAWGIGSRVMSLIIMPSIGFSKATSVLVGQHLGAGRPEQAGRAASIALLTIFAVMLTLAFFVLGAAPHIGQLFTRDEQVIKMAADYLRIVVFGFVFFALQETAMGALRGAGRTMEATFFSLLTLWVLQIPLAWIMGGWLGWGEDGIWWGIFYAKLIGSTITLLWFMRGTWRKAVIHDYVLEPVESTEEAEADFPF